MDGMNYDQIKPLHLYSEEEDVKFRIVKTHTWGSWIWAALTWIMPPLRFLWRSLGYKEDPETEKDSKYKGRVWEENVSQFILISLLAAKVPLTVAGSSLEWFLNFYHMNNGFVGLVAKIITLDIKGIVFDPKAHDESTYYSTIGWLDPRTDLIYPYSSKLKIDPKLGTFDYDSKIFADLCIMASKLAYESRSVQELVVSKQWNMSYQKFYEFLNITDKPNLGPVVDLIHAIIVSAEQSQLVPCLPFLKPLLNFLDRSTILRPNTEAFTFTDKRQDADLVVLAFRGTEPFSADDWSTDFDFSFMRLDEDFGSLHVGFLEALGLIDRQDIEGSSKRLRAHLNDPKEDLITGLSEEKILAESRKLLKFLGNKQHTVLSQQIQRRKVRELALGALAFDSISADLMQLLNKNPKARLVITGHSLGGALAAMFAAIVLSNNVEKNLLLKRLEAVYTFGQPRIGDKVFARFIANRIEKEKVKYYRVVYAYDLVPRVPFDDSIFGFRHFGFCCYNNILFQQKALIEQPNKNFMDVMFSPVMRMCAAWELVNGMVLNRVIYGDDFHDSGLMALARFVALITPGLVAHAPTNYVNAIRLGPSHLKIVPFEDS